MAVNRQKKKCGKRTDSNPSRPRYWARGNLVINKVRRMVRCSGYTPREAFKVWMETRKRHVGKFQVPSLTRIDEIR